MHKALEDVVVLGGLALQAEDCMIRAARQPRGEHGGLTAMENERHHQFIIWRAILPIWQAVLEREQSTDLILIRDSAKHHFELKNWRGSTGTAQLPSINADIRKLQARSSGYLLITSVNPVDHTDNNVAFLLNKVGPLVVSEQKDFRFRTVGTDGIDRDFWIAGWPVLQPQVA